MREETAADLLKPHSRACSNACFVRTVSEEGAFPKEVAFIQERKNFCVRCHRVFLQDFHLAIDDDAEDARRVTLVLNKIASGPVVRVRNLLGQRRY